MVDSSRAEREAMMSTLWTSRLASLSIDTSEIRSSTMWLNTSATYRDPDFTTEDPLEGHAYPSFYSTTHIAVSSFVVTVIMLVIVTGNVLVIVAVAVDRSLKGTQNWFIASLAVSDLLVGLFIMPLSLANELLGYWPFGDILCQLWLSTDVLLCTASILNLVLISVDRYWSITKAVSYVRSRTKRRAVAMIAIVWLLSMVICFPPLVGWKRPQPTKRGFPLCVLSEEPGYVVYSTVGSFYLPLVVMVVVYFKIYLVARRHARRHRRKSGGWAGAGLASNANGGLSQISMANDANAKNFHRNHLSRRIHYADDDDDCCHVSQMPEISSDVSNSLQTQDPELLGHGSDSIDRTGDDEEEIVHLNSDGVQHSTGARGEAEAADPQGDTATRHLLPNAKRLHLSTVNEHDSLVVFEKCRRLGHARGSRRARAKSLPGAAGAEENEAGPREGPPKAIHLKTIARHLWQTRSHRGPASTCTGAELNDRTNAPPTKIPIIKINSESRDHESSLEPPRGALLLGESLAVSNTKTHLPPPAPFGVIGRPSVAGESVDVQQRMRRRLARLKERRATLILGIVVASFVGCWLPFFSLYPISLLTRFEVPAAVFAFIFWLGYINSALNPIIYTIFNREFRQAFKRLLCGRRKV